MPPSPLPLTSTHRHVHTLSSCQTIGTTKPVPQGTHSQNAGINHNFHWANPENYRPPIQLSPLEIMWQKRTPKESFFFISPLLSVKGQWLFLPLLLFPPTTGQEWQPVLPDHQMGFVFGISGDKSSIFIELVMGRALSQLGQLLKKSLAITIWWQRSFWNLRVLPEDLEELFWTPQFQNRQKCGSTEPRYKCEQADSKRILALHHHKSSNRTGFVIWN